MKTQQFPLADVASYIKRGITPKYVDNDGFCVLNQKCIRDGRVNLEPARLTNKNTRISLEKFLQNGDILVNSTGTGTLGRTASFQYTNGFEQAVVDTHITIVRPNTGSVNPLYLAYVFRLCEPAIVNMARGATNQVELSARDLSLLPIKLRDRREQDHIASILSAYDELIENNRRRIELLEQAARLLYKEWFVHLRFPGHEHVKITDGVPEGWDKKTIGEFAPFKYGKALKKDERVPGPFSVYGSSGIVGTHEKALATGPSIIVGRKGNVGSIYWSKDDFHPIDTVYFIEAEHCTTYLYYVLLHTQFINTDVAVPGLNRDLAHSRTLLIPDNKILALFEQDVVVIHDHIDQLTKYNKALTKARDLLLPRLMNGEVAV